jgi:protein disulfide-isomerase A1
MDALPGGAESIIVCFRPSYCLAEPELIYFTDHRVVSHVLKRVLDPIVELDEQRFGAMKALDLPLLVLTRTRDDDLSFNVMSSLARQELSGRFFVGVMTDSPFAETVGTTPPFITAFNGLDETIPTYQGPFERTAVLEFANKVSSPLIRQCDLSSLVSFMKVKVL